MNSDRRPEDNPGLEGKIAIVAGGGAPGDGIDTRHRGNRRDIGHSVKFLLSDHARYITGQTLVVDGGVTIRSPERGANDT